MEHASKITVVVSLLIAISFNYSFASFDKNVMIHGVLAKYDNDFVWLKLAAGDKFQTTKISRKHFSNLKGYVVGTADIQAELPLEELIHLNPEIFK